MRYHKIDFLRGLVLIGMIFFHANYLLEQVFQVTIFHFSDVFWYILGRIIGIGFIIISGMSFFISTKNKTLRQIMRQSFRRFLMLSFLAMSITGVTYFFFYEQRIYFGILHFFALSSLVLIPFRSLGVLNIFIGIACILFGYAITTISMGSDAWLMFGLTSSDFFSADYYPLFPWFGYALIGYGIAVWFTKRGFFGRVFSDSIPRTSTLEYIGRHSLIVYMAHIPILFMTFYLLFSR